MVVNEATSSIQAKGTKTVIAVAAAMVAAGSVAQAAEYKDTDYSQTEAVTVNDKTHSAKVDANTITVNAGADVTFKGYNDAKNLQILGGKVTIDGSENTATNWNDSGLGGYGAAVTSGSLAPTTANNTLVQNAVVTVKSANLFGGNLEDTSTTPVTYSNATFDIVDSTINLAGTSERAGMIFASKAVPLSVKNSTIAVAKDQYGVVNAHDSVVLDGATLDVKGTLAFTVLAKDKNTADAFNDAAAAADVTVEMTSGAVNVASTGVLQMKDSFVVKGGTVTNDGTVTVTGARGLTLTNSTFTNNKRLDAQSVVIGNGATVVTAVSKVNADDSTQRDPSYNVLNTTIQEGGKLQLTELNSHSTMGSDGKPAGDVDQLLLGSSIANSPATVNLEGGQVYLKDQIFQGNLQLGKSAGTGASKDPAQTAVMNVNAEGYKLANVDIRTAGSALNVGTAGGKTGSLTVNDLKIVAGAANVHNGSLTVNGKLTNPDAASVTVAKEGTLNLTKDSIGLAITAGTGDTADKVEVASGFKTLTNNGTVVVSGLTGTTVKADTVQKIVGAIAANSSKGQVKLDGLAVDATGFSGYNTTDNTLTAAAAGKLNGVHLDQFKNTTVTGVSGADNSLNSSFGAIQLADAAGTDKAAALTIGADKSIYLNNSGNLVTDKDGKLADVALADGASFVTTGNNAVVGAVTGKSGNFTVQSGSLEVKGNVDVSDLTVNGALAVNEKAAVPASGETAAVQAVEYKVTTNNLTVNQGATLNVLHDLVLNAAAQGTNFDADIDGTATVKGKLDANGRTVNVGSDTTTGSLSVGTLANAVIFADPAWENGQEAARVAVKTLEGSTVEAGRNSIVAVGTTDITKAQAALAATGFKLGEVTATSTGLVNAAVYVTAEPKVGTDGKVDYSGTTVQGKVLASGAPTQTTTTISDGLTVKNGTLAILDATGFDKTGATAVVKGNVAVEDGAKVFVSGLKNGDKLKMSEVTTTVGAKAEVLYTGNMLMNFALAQDGTYQMTMEDRAAVNKALGNVAGLNAAYGMFEEGVDNNSSSAQFNKWLYTSTSSPKNDGTAAGNVEALRKVAGDVAALGATTGVQTMTMDAVNQMGDTVADRVSVLTQRAAGVNVWAAANGGIFEAKSLFDGAGYESDIYSGVLGVDYQFSCNAVLGAALTIGTADTDSKNTGVAASTDSDLVGFSVYTSKTFADMVGVSADIGYLTASNDVTANGYGQAWKFSQDTDAFTIGLRTEVLAEVGAVKFVPHVGIRYTALSTDGFEAGYKTDVDDQNIFQMPVGVTVSGDFQTGDWTVAPKFDLSVVPTFGDKDADLKLGITGVKATDDLSVRVMDSAPVQATLGVNATNGAWGFGLNYKLGLGSDDRTNNTFNVNVRYAF